MAGVIGVAQMPPPLFQIGLLNNVILRGTRRRDSDDAALAHRRSSRRRLSSKPLNLWFVIGDDGLQHALDNSVACAVEAAYRAERWFSEVIADATHVVKLFSAADVRIFVRDSKDDLLGRIVERDPTSTRRASPFPTHFPPTAPTTPLDIAQLPAEFRKFFASHAANTGGGVDDDNDDDDDDDDDDQEDKSGEDEEATEELDLDGDGDGATQATTPSDVVRKLFLWRFDDETAVDGEPVAPASVLPLDNARCHLVLLIRDRTAPIAPSSAAIDALPPLSLEKLSTNARTAVSPRGLAHSFGSMPRDALSTRLFGTKLPPTSPNGTMRHDNGSASQQATLVAALRSPNLVHDLFVWNGSSASAFVRAACLSKGFELERALEADVGAVQALFDGRWQGAQAAPMCALVNDTTAPTGDDDGAPLNSLLFHLRFAAGVADGRMRARRQNLFERAPPRRVATDSEAMAASRSASVSAIVAPASQRPTKGRGSVVNVKAKTVSVKRPLMSATSELPLPKMRTAATRDNSAAVASTSASGEGGGADIAARKVAFASTTNLQRDAKGRPTNISPNALKLKSMSFKPGLPKIDLTLVREVDKAPILSGAEQVRFFDPICSKITDCVYLGSRTPAMSRDMLKQNGITHILNCAGTICDNYFPDEFNYTTLALIDGGSEDIMCVLYHVLDLFEEVQRADGRVFVHCFPAADHQILTDRGFLFLDEVEALVERDENGAVRDWRGLKVASYDPASRQLCYETPRALVVNDAPADLVEISSKDVSVVATHEHALFVGSGDGDDSTFKKRAAHEVAEERGARHHFMTAAVAGVGVPRSKRRPVLRTDNVADKTRASADERRRLCVSGATGDSALDIADADLVALAELYGYCLGRSSGTANDGDDDDDAFVCARLHVAPLVSSFGAIDRVAPWVFELDGALARRVVFGLEQQQQRQQQTRMPGVLFAESAALRDDLQRVLLHAGFSVVFDGCESRWRLTYAEAATVAFAAGDGDVVERRTGVPGRTWCFDMSDGFVMVRRAQRAPLCGGGAPVVVAASRPTIQGNCHAGISRSSTFVVAYVMWKKRRSYEAALKQVKDIRATVSPNFGFNMQLHTWWTRINAPPQPRLYRVISHSQDPDFLVPKHVPTLSAASLDPRTCFVLHTAERVWAWHGERAMPRYRDACTRIHRQLVRYESAPSPLIGVQQGSEPAAFWAAIGGRAAVTESSAYNSDYSASVLYAKKPASLLNRAFVEEDSSQSDGERALLYLYPNNFLIDTVTAADFERVFVSEPEELEENCLYILVSSRRDQLFAWLGREFTPPSGAPGVQFAMDALKSFKKLQQHLFAAPPRTTVVQGGAALNEQFVDTILTV
jgi:hypothetical protein